MSGFVFKVCKERSGSEGKFNSWEYFATHYPPYWTSVPPCAQSLKQTPPAKSINELAAGINKFVQSILSRSNNIITNRGGEVRYYYEYYYTIDSKAPSPSYAGDKAYIGADRGGNIRQSAECSTDELGELVLEIERLKAEKK